METVLLSISISEDSGNFDVSITSPSSVFIFTSFPDTTISEDNDSVAQAVENM